MSVFTALGVGATLAGSLLAVGFHRAQASLDWLRRRGGYRVRKTRVYRSTLVGGRGGGVPRPRSSARRATNPEEVRYARLTGAIRGGL